MGRWKMRSRAARVEDWKWNIKIIENGIWGMCKCVFFTVLFSNSQKPCDGCDYISFEWRLSLRSTPKTEPNENSRAEVSTFKLRDKMKTEDYRFNSGWVRPTTNSPTITCHHRAYNVSRVLVLALMVSKHNVMRFSRLFVFFSFTILFVDRAR